MAEALAHRDPGPTETGEAPMQSASAGKPNPEAGPISAAIAASADGLAPRHDLETALTDASLFGRLAYHAFCNLGFEKLEPPTLDREENELVYWTISELSGMVDAAKAAFHEANARKRGSS